MQVNLSQPFTDEQNIYICNYHSKKSGLNDAASQFIWDFKDGALRTIKPAIGALTAALSHYESKFKRISPKWHIISIPGSQKGCAKPHYQYVCTQVASRFDWLSSSKNALVRTESVNKSHTSPLGQRPDYSTHVASIVYEGPAFSDKDGIIIFDDVYTRGATSDACRDIIVTATPCAKVIGLFLGKTV